MVDTTWNRKAVGVGFSNRVAARRQAPTLRAILFGPVLGAGRRGPEGPFFRPGSGTGANKPPWPPTRRRRPARGPARGRRIVTGGLRFEHVQVVGDAGRHVGIRDIELFHLAVKIPQEGREIIPDPVLAGVLGLDRIPDDRPVLSVRENEVLALLLDGRTSKEIAVRLRISPRTVDTYRERLHQKIGSTGLAELAWKATRMRLVPAKRSEGE